MSFALDPSGTGKTHVALGLGLSACQKGLSVGFVTAAALVHELMEARDERRLLRLQKQMVSYKLLLIDELRFVPLIKTGPELLFELISQRYERVSTLITSNLPFDEWTETFGSERLTGARLDRLTHHVNILEINVESYRLGPSKARQATLKTKLQSASIGPDGQKHPSNRQLYDKCGRPDAGARLDADYPNPKVATFCATHWPTFTPTLTEMLAMHKHVEATAAFRPHECWFLYLPPYRPNLNPIEQAFSKLKAHLRRVGARNCTELFA